MIEFLVFGLLALSVICLWLLIEGRKNATFLLWFIPILLVLVTSTYITYTSILGFPKIAIPDEGVYIKHYVDEPNWIYLWVVEKDNIPRSYQIPFTKGGRDALEKVKGKNDEGRFMVLARKSNSDGADGQEKGDDSAGGYTIGGDISFYEWDHTHQMAPKN